MAQKTISGNLKLAEKIKARRNELNLTIEEAARRAGIGTKSWSRYESGASIRQDKYKGVCKALNWIKLPTDENEDNSLNLTDYYNHEAWSKYLAENFGEIAAISFAIGSDILFDYIKEDLEELSTQPKGTHIGQLGTSYIASFLPQQFLMNYNYDFLYAMKLHLIRLRNIAKSGNQIIAHSVLDEIILQLLVDESEFLIENDTNLNVEDGWKDWIYDLFGDMDVITCLYSNMYISKDNCYHFSHWLDEQFYCDL